MFINSSEKFAAYFNEKFPGVYRAITAEDALNLKSCELIHRYGFYGTSQDGKTVMGILKYEQIMESRPTQEAHDEMDPRQCKMCGQPLPPELESKTGRPKEYCSGCESLRNKDRQMKWRRRRRKHCKPTVA